MCVRQQKIPVLMLICEWCKNSQKRLGPANASRMLPYSGATLVPYRTGPYRHCRGSPEARVAVPLLVQVLLRTANPLGGRRLCPRFADHTGRLTSFKTPYLSLSSLPSWQGSTDPSGWRIKEHQPKAVTLHHTLVVQPQSSGFTFKSWPRKKRVQSSAPAVPPAP